MGVGFYFYHDKEEHIGHNTMKYTVLQVVKNANKRVNELWSNESGGTPLKYMASNTKPRLQNWFPTKINRGNILPTKKILGPYHIPSQPEDFTELRIFCSRSEVEWPLL